MQYSSLCETSVVAYLAYLSAITGVQYVEWVGRLSGLDGCGSRAECGCVRCFAGCGSGGLASGPGAEASADVGLLVGGDGDVGLDDSGSGDTGAVGEPGSGAGGGSARVAGFPGGVVGSVSDGLRGNVGVGCESGLGGWSVPVVKGKHWRKNQRRRARRVVGRCETVASGASVPVVQVEPARCSACGAVVQACTCGWDASRGAAVAGVVCRKETVLQEAERKARESLAARRDVENRVAARKAELHLASLNDERKVAEYEVLRRQRMVQWQNEAKARSQKSVNSCQSYDPSSSATEAEFREQAKRLADLEDERNTMLDVLLKRVGAQVMLEVTREVAALHVGTSTEAEFACEAAEYTCGFV